MSVGSWEIEPSIGALPQKVASAIGALQLFGCEYTPIAYLGLQVVNGINHAILAEQLVTTGKDTRNIVVMIFNEKPGSMDNPALVNIERVVESGGELGGIKVDPSLDIPEDAKKALDTVFAGFVGSKVEPFVYLGSQVTKGVDYIFAATLTSVTANPIKKVCLLTVNELTKVIGIHDLLTTKHDVNKLGYSFTWLKHEDTSLGAPLGEWP